MRMCRRFMNGFHGLATILKKFLQTLQKEKSGYTAFQR